MKFLFVIILIFNNCYYKKNDNSYILLNLIESYTYAIFSYPGRFTSSTKKREVINEILTILENTKESLHIYAYSFNNPEIIEKLNELRSRGVKVYITLDKDKTYTLLDLYNIPKQFWKGSGLHHLKIIISDHKKLLLGTGNFSEFGLTNDWNGYIVFTIDNKFADKFILNLEEKLSSVDLSIYDTKFLFSPEKGILIQDVLLSEMSNAKESIKVLAFDHYDEIVSHVLKKASLRGVAVSVIYNDPIDPEGIYLNNEFFGLNSKIFKDGNFDTIEKLSGFPEGGLLHHKTIIIDNKILLTGSFNFSINARENNREIHLRSTNPILVKAFIDEYDRIEKSSYLVNPKERNWDHSSIASDLIYESDRVCMTKDKIGSSTLELGEGIFKTYLRYSRLKPNNCFLFETYDLISTGISNFKNEKSTRSNFLWDNFSSIERRGTTTYFNSPKYEINFSNLEIYNPTQMDTSMKNKLIVKYSEIYIQDYSRVFYYSPSFSLREGIIHRIGDEYHIEIEIPLEEKKRGVLFIENRGINLFSCFYTKGNESKTVNFLLDKIAYESGRSGTICRELR